MRYILLAIYLSALIGCSGSSGDSDSVQVKIDTNSSGSVESSEGENIANENDNPETSDIEVGSQTDEVQTGQNIEKMEIGKVYTLYHRDRIQEIDSAKIRVVKNSETDNFRVTLIEGEAKIIRGGN